MFNDVIIIQYYSMLVIQCLSVEIECYINMNNMDKNLMGQYIYRSNI